MTTEAAFQAICERPEDDDARLRFADFIESADPDHATYIRLSIADAVRRRHDLEEEYLATCGPLEARNKARWAHNLLRFLPRHHDHDGRVGAYGMRFDRGFPTQIAIHPHVFLEYADLLFRLAPIRHVRFMAPYGQDEYLPGPVPTLDDGTLEQFPLDQILAMPQLSRLESFGFDRRTDWDKLLPRDTWTSVAKCQYLTRCHLLDTGDGIFPDVQELAAGPLTSKMLRIEPIGSENIPGAIHRVGEYERSEYNSEYGGHKRTFFGDEGKELERRHGYIPWLHPSHCTAHLFDLAYLVEQGELPKYKPGTAPMDEWYEFPVEVHARQPWHREW